MRSVMRSKTGLDGYLLRKSFYMRRGRDKPGMTSGESWVDAAFRGQPSLRNTLLEWQR